jgi:hypothetical protein
MRPPFPRNRRHTSQARVRAECTAKGRCPFITLTSVHLQLTTLIFSTFSCVLALVITGATTSHVHARPRRVASTSSRSRFSFAPPIITLATYLVLLYPRCIASWPSSSFTILDSPTQYLEVPCTPSTPDDTVLALSFLPTLVDTTPLVVSPVLDALPSPSLSPFPRPLPTLPQPEFVADITLLSSTFLSTLPSLPRTRAFLFL